jgi:hypothetical protein
MENTKQAWTPGPWTYRKNPMRDDGFFVDAGGMVSYLGVRNLDGSSILRPAQTITEFQISKEADAKLIAKAPELVESLKEFVALANFDADTLPKTNEEWDAMVAKAERILREAGAID